MKPKRMPYLMTKVEREKGLKIISQFRKLIWSFYFIGGLFTTSVPEINKFKLKKFLLIKMEKLRRFVPKFLKKNLINPEHKRIHYLVKLMAAFAGMVRITIKKFVPLIIYLRYVDKLRRSFRKSRARLRAYARRVGRRVVFPILRDEYLADGKDLTDGVDAKELTERTRDYVIETNLDRLNAFRARTEHWRPIPPMKFRYNKLGKRVPCSLDDIYKRRQNKYIPYAVSELCLAGGEWLKRSPISSKYFFSDYSVKLKVFNKDLEVFLDFIDEYKTIVDDYSYKFSTKALKDNPKFERLLPNKNALFKLGIDRTIFNKFSRPVGVSHIASAKFD